ncbi:hypothetical protein [Nocardioides alpinus]|uniref:Low temperature requirement A protein (LtrA) n=2 Tax=Nocardioides alpinus TaxID=748909 RepID=A0ABX4QVZ8_9ACTN|nr:hypothetical protein [Nocardioides alpinus]PKH40514.1 hypothetical protein CXG46_12890 [Nocardioides alpinus]
MAPGSALLRVVQRTRSDPALRRESDMMGVYVSIALLAALIAGNDHAGDSQFGVLKVVWGTTLGLALAHWFAVTLSARLVHDPDPHHTAAELFASQVVVVGLVTVAATLVVALLPVDVERLGARLTAAAFLGVLVVVESRAGGSSTGRAAAYGVGALAVAALIATIKWFVSY